MPDVHRTRARRRAAAAARAVRARALSHQRSSEDTLSTLSEDLRVVASQPGSARDPSGPVLLELVQPHQPADPRADEDEEAQMELNLLATQPMLDQTSSQSRLSSRGASRGPSRGRILGGRARSKRDLTSAERKLAAREAELSRLLNGVAASQPLHSPRQQFKFGPEPHLEDVALAKEDQLATHQSWRAKVQHYLTDDPYGVKANSLTMTGELPKHKVKRIVDFNGNVVPSPDKAAARKRQPMSNNHVHSLKKMAAVRPGKRPQGPGSGGADGAGDQPKVPQEAFFGPYPAGKFVDLLTIYQEATAEQREEAENNKVKARPKPSTLEADLHEILDQQGLAQEPFFLDHLRALRVKRQEAGLDEDMGAEGGGPVPPSGAGMMASAVLGMVSAATAAQANKPPPIKVTLDQLLNACFPLLRPIERRRTLRWIDTFDANMDAAVGGEHALASEGVAPEKIAELKKIFELYDIDGSGFISPSEIIESLQRGQAKSDKRAARQARARGAVIEGMTVQEVDDAIKMFDLDGNSELSLDEFVLAFKDVI